MIISCSLRVCMSEMRTHRLLSLSLVALDLGLELVYELLHAGLILAVLLSL